MTGEEMNTIRRRIGYSTNGFARAIGYHGEHKATMIRQYENGSRDIPPWIATAVRALDQHSLLALLRSFHKSIGEQCAHDLSNYLTKGHV